MWEGLGSNIEFDADRAAPIAEESARGHSEGEGRESPVTGAVARHLVEFVMERGEVPMRPISVGGCSMAAGPLAAACAGRREGGCVGVCEGAHAAGDVPWWSGVDGNCVFGVCALV